MSSASVGSISVQIEDDGLFESLLAQIEVDLRRRGARFAVTAAGRVVQKRAKQLCPRSTQTKSREGWSNATEAERASVKPLADTIGVVTRNYDDVFVAVVGPQYPAGALGHLVEYGHAAVLWGQVTGDSVPPKPFMRPAADETRDAQISAIEAKLKTFLP